MVAKIPSLARRRTVLALALCGAALVPKTRVALSATRADETPEPQKRWFEAALSMKRPAESRGDQPYGAVLVADGEIIGEGPSRVVQRGDPTAHAEREAIRDAQRRLGRSNLSGSVLYSTSRPCRLCEAAAAEAKVARMIHGDENGATHEDKVSDRASEHRQDARPAGGPLLAGFVARLEDINALAAALADPVDGFADPCPAA